MKTSLEPEVHGSRDPGGLPQRRFWSGGSSHVDLDTLLSMLPLGSTSNLPLSQRGMSAGSLQSGVSSQNCRAFWDERQGAVIEREREVLVRERAVSARERDADEVLRKDDLRAKREKEIARAEARLTERENRCEERETEARLQHEAAMSERVVLSLDCQRDVERRAEVATSAAEIRKLVLQMEAVREEGMERSISLKQERDSLQEREARVQMQAEKLVKERAVLCEREASIQEMHLMLSNQLEGSHEVQFTPYNKL